MDIDNARAHISKREQQRVRGERIIDITACSARARPELHPRRRSGTRDLEQIDDAAQHPSAESDTDSQRQNPDKRVKNAGRSLKNGRHRRGLEHGIVGRTPPI